MENTSQKVEIEKEPTKKGEKRKLDQAEIENEENIDMNSIIIKMEKMEDGEEEVEKKNVVEVPKDQVVKEVSKEHVVKEVPKIKIEKEEAEETKDDNIPEPQAKGRYFENRMPSIYFEKTKEGFLPDRATPFAAGYDLRSAYNYKLEANTVVRVDTGLTLVLPRGYVARIIGRPSLISSRIDVVGVGGPKVIDGIINNDSRGRIFILVQNNGDKDCIIQRGQRIAQVLFQKYYIPKCFFNTKDIANAITYETQSFRGTHGEGSTGNF